MSTVRSPRHLGHALLVALAVPILLPGQAPDTTDAAALPAGRSAQALLDAARAARLRVDSSLRSYDALARERFTLALALRGAGRERVVTRQESAGRVQWAQGRGVRVDVLGRRVVDNSPFSNGSAGGAETTVPVPWFPGKEPLWGLGSAFASTTIDERSSVHPLASGAEQFYRYAIGDSLTISLPDGTRILLRELRASPRQASWRVLAASLWFEVRTAQLVRAAYRYATPVDLWAEGRRTPDPANRPPRWLALVASPLRGTLESVTVESGLYEGRFWLPRQQVADFRVEAPGDNVARVRLEQRFQYTVVNGAVDMPPSLPAESRALLARADSLWQVDSTQAALRDSLLKSARSTRDSARLFAAYRRWEDSSWKPVYAALDSVRKTQCAATGTYARYRSRYGRRLPAEVYVPCDSVKLARADVFTGDLLAQNDAVWSDGNRAALVQSLAEAVPLAWSPQPIRVATGLEFLRYNRVEGLSLGGALRQELGPGLRWEANLRGSVADRQVNGELLAERTRADGSIRVAGYRRLVQADDYGAAFALGSTFQNLFVGLDQQFYYRAAGAEVMGTRARTVGGGSLQWRLFAEAQREARGRDPWVVARLWDRDAGFDQHLVDTLGAAARGTWGGASLRWRGLRGDDASGWRLSSDLRLEAAAGTANYGRVATDLTVERRLPGQLRATIVGSGGTSVGALPWQRTWALGGWQTMRGHIAGRQRGDAFWMGHAELQYEGLRRMVPVVFADQGWAGPRGTLVRDMAPLRSVGAGIGFFRGLTRIDAARSLGPDGTWRISTYATTRF